MPITYPISLMLTNHVIVHLSPVMVQIHFPFILIGLSSFVWLSHVCQPPDCVKQVLLDVPLQGAA